MNRRLAFALALAAGFVIVGAAPAKPPVHKPAAKEIVMMADQMEFKEIVPGVSKAMLWGDAKKGPYAAITRFTKGYKIAMHYHSHNIKAIVISGTFIYDSGNGEQRLGPGSYLLEPKGKHHTSGAGDDADCVFLEESDGPFDIIDVK